MLAGAGGLVVGIFLGITIASASGADYCCSSSSQRRPHVAESLDVSSRQEEA